MVIEEVEKSGRRKKVQGKKQRGEKGGNVGVFIGKKRVPT